MSTVFYAQPYDISAVGFYFESIEEYRQKAARLRNVHGQQVEEFELQFVDGKTIDALLFGALSISQATIADFIEKLDEWDEHEKSALIIAVGECGYDFDPSRDDPSDFEIDLYEFESLRELAENFVDEGLFGEIPENLQHYIDYEAIARDLAADYSETTINGRSIIYRCG